MNPSLPTFSSVSRSLRRLQRSRSVLAGAALLALAACASTPPPKEQMAVAEAAVASASSAGALQWAPAELRVAQDKLSRAQSALAAKDHARAGSLAMEADVDARLATAAAGAAKAKKAAEEVQEADRALREEMSRKAPGNKQP